MQACQIPTNVTSSLTSTNEILTSVSQQPISQSVSNNYSTNSHSSVLPNVTSVECATTSSNVDQALNCSTGNKYLKDNLNRVSVILVLNS